MNSVIRRSVNVLTSLMLVAGIAGAFPAHAQHTKYKYTTIDYPGALCTQVFGMNSAGDVVGTAAFLVDCSGTAFSFVFHVKSQTLTVLPTFPGADATAAVGVNHSGSIVGFAGDGTTTTGVGFILKGGAFRVFEHPGSVQTLGRAIGSSGLVTGSAVDGANNDIPFIYDPTWNRFTDITISGLRPFPYFSTAQGINGKGEVVGNFSLDAGYAYAGAPGGQYGFLRDGRGVVTLFRVNGYGTRARGITESSRIAGFLTDPVLGKDRGFVVRLKTTGGFQSLTVLDSELLDVPGATATNAEGVDELGRVSGSWTDASGVSHGFIATPLDK
jgi:uncharacterized membrane protein